MLCGEQASNTAGPELKEQVQDKSANEDLEATVLFASHCQTMLPVHATSRHHGLSLVVIEQENEPTGPKTEERCCEKSWSKEVRLFP